MCITNRWSSCSRSTRFTRISILTLQKKNILEAMKIFWF